MKTLKYQRSPASGVADPGGSRTPDGASRSWATRPEHAAWAVGAAACWARSPVTGAPPAMPGFDYKFLEKPKRQLLCPLCGKPMREPVQVTTCGHRFWDTCLQKFLSEGVFKCLEDQLPLDYAKIYSDPELEVQVFRLGYMLHPQ